MARLCGLDISWPNATLFWIIAFNKMIIINLGLLLWAIVPNIILDVLISFELDIEILKLDMISFEQTTLTTIKLDMISHCFAICVCCGLKVGFRGFDAKSIGYIVNEWNEWMGGIWTNTIITQVSALLATYSSNMVSNNGTRSIIWHGYLP